MTVAQILGYVLLILALFVSASTFTGCKAAKTTKVLDVFYTDTLTGEVFNLKTLRK